MPADPENEGEYASPACSMHDVDPAYMGLDRDRLSGTEVEVWRQAERKRLIEARLAVAAAERGRRAVAIAANLDRVLDPSRGRVISLYWPIRGEPDLREWMASATQKGATCLLPVIVAKGQPLAFRAWKHGDPLERGVWNIPFPANGEAMVPDVVIAPVVGYDASCYRLGYGGGYYDRTLAALGPGPLVIGVGYDFQHIPTIHPQPHDIAMDIIVTDEKVIRRSGERRRPSTFVE